ncbi:triose-phosphate isomerase [cf. Phormidesmis sp. LEGE 11477]|uniref:triose-phosphate isomerase n=1 Tax=cf. Phormidesmis sp. LEGE 11477 TaxID=1828680 RepID=UPI0018800F5C|nr:triose-phosphate isomerase [cf. Phormidesmis sp. LEGE 11477]
MRKVVIAGNWKMHKTQADASAFVQQLMPQLEGVPDERELVLCAPFTTLGLLVDKLQGSRVQVGAQNIHWEREGAYTGEISGPMLKEVGVRYVVVGHSERRQYFGETDETVNARLKAAQINGLTPILCVGETKQQRDANETESVIVNQIKQALVDINQFNLVIAYEPIWAIGTGDTCAAADANDVIGKIRSLLDNQEVSIQYGGSVKPENVDEIMAQSEIDGALVGGASLMPDSFARLANYRA